jgi:hypothetical protein
MSGKPVDYIIESQHRRGQKFRVRERVGQGLQGAMFAFRDRVIGVAASDAHTRIRWGVKVRLVAPNGRVVEVVDVEGKRREMLKVLEGEAGQPNGVGNTQGDRG